MVHQPDSFAEIRHSIWSINTGRILTRTTDLYDRIVPFFPNQLGLNSSCPRFWLNDLARWFRQGSESNGSIVYDRFVMVAVKYMPFDIRIICITLKYRIQDW